MYTDFDKLRKLTLKEAREMITLEGIPVVVLFPGGATLEVDDVDMLHEGCDIRAIAEDDLRYYPYNDPLHILFRYLAENALITMRSDMEVEFGMEVSEEQVEKMRGEINELASEMVQLSFSLKGGKICDELDKLSIAVFSHLSEKFQ